MHPELKREPIVTSLARIARELLAPCLPIERFVARSGRGGAGAHPLTDGLQLLGTLAQDTRASLPGSPATALAAGASPDTAANAAAASAPATAPRPPRPASPAAPRAPSVPARPAYGSAHGEYRPALRDPSVIEALLRLNRGSPKPAARAAGTPAAPRITPTVPPLEDAPDPSKFRSWSVPEIDARPKPTASGSRHLSPGRILR